MSHIYVLALTSHKYPSLVVDEHRIEFIKIDNVFAAVERRAAPPVVSEAELRSQHHVVNGIFNQTDDLLPVRFGAWIDRDELSKVVSRQQESIRHALQLVRGRAQMTIRFLAPSTVRAEDQQSRRYPESGTEYLRTRRDAQHWMPDEATALKAAVRDLVVAERFSPRAEAAGSSTRVKLGPVASLYHLISRDAVTAYSAATLPFRNATVTVTGPWAPFAFAPDPWL